MMTPTVGDKVRLTLARGGGVGIITAVDGEGTCRVQLRDGSALDVAPVDIAETLDGREFVVGEHVNIPGNYAGVVTAALPATGQVEVLVTFDRNFGRHPRRRPDGRRELGHLQISRRHIVAIGELRAANGDF